MRKLLFVAIVAVLLPECAAAEKPDCAGPVEVDHATIIRVEKNGALILRDGRATHLEGIRLPAGAADHAPQFLADQALAVLTQFAVGHEVTLSAVAPKEDRYDRIRAQVFDGDTWIQKELLKRGLARVSIAPDRTECASELFAAETQARVARAGLWSSSAYAVRAPENVFGDVGTFQLVEGKVVAADVHDGRAWLDFGTGRSELGVVIAPNDLKIYRSMGVDPRGYAGKTVRVRGVVQNLGGPAIAIANPVQVEVIDAP